MEIYDPAGNRVPQGRVRRELTASFYDGAALGSGEQWWLSSSSGTVTIDPTATTGGGIHFVTAASNGATALVQTTMQWQLRYFRSIKLCLDGFRLDAASGAVDIEISMNSGTTMGARFFQLAADTSMSVQAYGSGAYSENPSSFTLPLVGSGPPAGSRNLAFEVRGRQGQDDSIIMWQDDQIAYRHAMSTTWAQTAGAIQPTVKITSKGTAIDLKIAQMRLVIEKNA